MRRYSLLFAILCGLFIYACGAEEFIVSTPSKKKRTISQLKQDIGSRYGDILRQESEIIAQKARLQHLVYDRLEQLISTDEELFKGIQIADLEIVLSELDAIHASNDKELAAFKEQYAILSKRSFKRPNIGHQKK